MTWSTRFLRQDIRGFHSNSSSFVMRKIACGSSTPHYLDQNRYEDWIF